ncbi:hypothetical protein QBC34DRAFT_383556 [Podospora aff. communis PSN243]|uniref:Uncharacterized protein n=1 Tax=Podospora aff. communis PSN243 TaxID=3040156 RepID=A0AAV9GBB2_9PEZI|nr:hypothetical protein QBC34DRAFT_383556 [Podospora aff. communis PSN243]
MKLNSSLPFTLFAATIAVPTPAASPKTANAFEERQLSVNIQNVINVINVLNEVITELNQLSQQIPMDLT